MTVTQQDVVGAGIALLDKGGLPAVTLRRVAERLGVQAPTLYWHVRGKRHLLDLMAEEIVRTGFSPELAEPAPGQDVWDWLTERSRALRQSLLSHPNSVQVIAGNRPTAESLPYTEKRLAAMVRAGFTPGDALRALFSLGAYVSGAVLEAEAEAARPHEAKDADEGTRGELLGGGFPTARRAAEDVLAQDDEEQFEFGLQALIAGLRASLS